MADGIVAASEEHPDAIVDIATLTGAQVVALGERYSAVMGEDALVARLLDAAREQGESMWGMPLPEEMRALLNSDIADIANVKPGNPAGGMLVAGVFLKEFVGRTGDGDDAPRIPWAHVDIAGRRTTRAVVMASRGRARRASRSARSWPWPRVFTRVVGSERPPEGSRACPVGRSHETTLMHTREILGVGTEL